MKHYLDLVPISAKVHRKQNRMSIFCIILAVFLITTIFGMADMFIRSQIIQAKIDNGDFHITVQGITDEEAGLIKKRPDVKAAARYGVLNFNDDKGYAISDKKSIIVGADEEFVTQLQMGIINEGNFPQNDNEAMITKNAGENLGLQIGDTVTIKRPGEPELFYQISGFCNNTSKIMSEDAYGVFLTTSAFREIGDISDSTVLADHNMVLFVQFTKTYNIQNTINRLKEDCNLSEEQISENTKLLGLLGQSSNSFMVQVYMSAIILFLLVMFAGIIMIASSLNSNVLQRTEFFGLIRCIGATPKQVMKLVNKEALSWCRFAIPVGVATGIVVVWVLCAVLRVLSPEYFGAIPTFSFSLPSIVAGIAIGLLTVLLAAHSPAKKAAKVSPLTAVSGNALNLRPVRKAANTKIFKVETSLGIYHAISSKKNFILMVLSFSISIVLFLSFTVAIAFTNHTITPLRPWTADISIISPQNTCSIDNLILEKLEKNPIVNAAYGRMFSYDVPTIVNDDSVTLDIISYEQKQFDWAKDYLLQGSTKVVQSEVNTGLIVYSPENNIEVGDTVNCRIGDKSTEIQIAGILSDCPFNTTSNGILICSENTFQKITGQNKYTIIDIQLDKNATDTDVNALHQMIGNDFTFSDERMGNESTRGIYYCMCLFLYGFLVIVALITIFNIINSIALSVAARTKQYGAFRAIGVSTKQLTKMIIAEAATYTISGTVIGTILGLIFHKLLFGMMISYNWGDPWAIPWTELGIIVLIMLFSIIFAVYRPVKRLQKMSIVENISAQ
ncbi:MAG: ABC transporter permease [Lachnospiraceae bacterium]